MAKPDLLRIPHEEWEDGRFHLVGRTADGGQFMAFVTGAFPADWWSGARPAEQLRERWAEHKRWYAVLHRFGPEGEHVSTEPRSGGTTAGGEAEAWERADRELARMLRALGPYRPCDIRVRPFGVELDGYFFGLAYTNENPNDADSAGEYVMLEPNDIMFHPPWDSGQYST